MIALVDGEPRVLSLKRALQLFIEHRREVITRRTKYELAQAKHRAHVLEGLKVALDHLDEVIDTIRRSRSADTALTNLQRKFKLTEVQARAILDLQLRRLAALERRKIEEEYAETLKRIKYLQGLLRSRTKILQLIKTELQDLKESYGDERRTRVSEKQAESITVEDLIPEEDLYVVVTRQGMVRRLSRRSNPLATSAKDRPKCFARTNTLHSVIFCTNKGRCVTTLVHQIPNAQSSATSASALLGLDADETVVSVIDVPDFASGDQLTLCTVQGRIKRTAVSEFSGVRSGGLIAMNLDGDDELGWARLTNGQEQLILVTAGNQALRFAETEVRSMGRTAAGVNAIKLAADDRVVAMGVVEEATYLVVVSARGYAKRTPLSQYPTQGRYGKGVATFSGSEADTGPLAAACVAGEADSLMVLLASGGASRLKASEIPSQGRATRGSQVIQPRSRDAVSGLIRLAASLGARRASAKSAAKPKTKRPSSSRKRPTSRSKPGTRKRSTGASKRSPSAKKTPSKPRSRRTTRKS
jgi:DNA gyrase subunit A